MWRELIAPYCKDATYGPACSGSEVADACGMLGVSMPEALVSILTEANGIDGEYGEGVLWPLQRIIADNQAFRSNPDFRGLYMPFDCLLFFADAGNGDQFAFPILDGKCRREDVFVWNHEDDSRSWVAPGLQTFYEWWLTGRIAV